MAVATDQAPVHPIFTGWRGVVLALSMLFCVAFLFEEGIDRVARYNVLGLAYGGSFAIMSADLKPGFPEGFRRATQVAPGGPADKAEIRVGDLFRSDLRTDDLVNKHVGDSAGLTVVHEGKPRHVTVTALPLPSSYVTRTRGRLSRIALSATVVQVLFSALLFWRGWRRLAPCLLGFTLLGTDPLLQIGHWALGSPVLTALALIAHSLTKAMFALFLPFVLALYTECVGRVGRAWWRASAAQFAITLSVWLYMAYAEYNGVWLPLYSPTHLLAWLVTAPGVLAGFYWAWRGWRSELANATNRFSVILIAMGILVVVPLHYYTTIDLGGDFDSRHVSILLVADFFFMRIVAPAMLAYAALRHRLVDLGFAINRTLVFGTISFVMLAAFGLLEWATHHLLPEEWAKGSEWVDGGIALALFLVFHRVRDWVEHRVEHWFFHDWQVNEARLRRFVTSAAHFEHRDALVQAFGAELQRFCGVPAAVYLREGAALSLAAGDWTEAPPVFTADDPAFALLRAERSPLDLTETPTDLPGVLALPMLDHGTLSGVALLPAKADGALYRPDEVELLGWAALQVGLDLAALRARHLEVENQRLATRVETLAGLLRPAAPAP